VKQTIFASSTSTTASGEVYNLLSNLSRSNVAGVNSLQGNLIKVSKISLKGNFLMSQTAGNVCRVILFRWMDATLPTASGVTTYAGSGSVSPYAPILWTNVHKIKVLFDKIVPLSFKGGATIGEFETILSGASLPPVQFPSGGTSGLTPQMNGLFVLTISDDLVVSYPVATFVAEILYTDA
jgi:hypothetical protein